jgi:hypothetical protein
MKKLITICFLTFFVATGNAQVKKKKDLNELNQVQLNLELTKSLKKITAAKTWTGIGVGLGIIGGAFLIDDANKRHNSTEMFGGLPTSETEGGILVLAGGIITIGFAIPTWIKASNRKKDIEFELVKFNPPGSASINGIGLKIRF